MSSHVHFKRTFQFLPVNVVQILHTEVKSGMFSNETRQAFMSNWLSMFLFQYRQLEFFFFQGRAAVQLQILYVTHSSFSRSSDTVSPTLSHLPARINWCNHGYGAYLCELTRSWSESRCTNRLLQLWMMAIQTQNVSTSPDKVLNALLNYLRHFNNAALLLGATVFHMWLLGGSFWESPQLQQHKAGK